MFPADQLSRGRATLPEPSTLDVWLVSLHTESPFLPPLLCLTEWAFTSYTYQGNQHGRKQCWCFHSALASSGTLFFLHCNCGSRLSSVWWFGPGRLLPTQGSTVSHCLGFFCFQLMTLQARVEDIQFPFRSPWPVCDTHAFCLLFTFHCLGRDTWSYLCKVCGLAGRVKNGN